MVEEIITITMVLILFTALMLIMQERIKSMISIFTWQSVFLALATFFTALKTQELVLYISAALILILKAFVIPYLLHYLVKKLNVRRKVATIKHPFLLSAGAALLVLFCYHLTIHTHAFVDGNGSNANNVLAVGMAIVLLGMLLLITQTKAISHTIGFMSMENGIFLAALLTTQGMPMAVELGIAFDVLIAVILFGVFFFQLRQSIDSLDVDRLNLLREDIE